MVVFDMAGTTVKDDREVETCFMQAAIDSNLPFSSGEIISMMGWSKRLVFETLWKKALPDANFLDIKKRTDQSYDLFRDILENHYKTAPVLPTDGCLEIFEWLKQRDIKIALTTGFYRKVTNIILQRLGWNIGLDINYIGKEYINVSVSSDEVPLGRPQPFMIQLAMKKMGIANPKQVVNIGDTPSDLESGVSADCFRSFGVTNGTHSYEQLSKLKNDGLLEKILDLKTEILALESKS
jgi:phosphonatase-like hydrolase